MTKSLVDAMEPADTEYAVYDDLVPRLCVRVLPSGVKTYWLRLRQEKEQRWIRLGRHAWDVPVPEMAREEATRQLGLKAAGVDITLKRNRAKNTMTVKELSERFMKKYAVAKMTKSSRATYETLLKHHILPRLGHLRIDKLRKADVLEMALAMHDRPVAANRSVSVLRSMLARAIEWELLVGPNVAGKVETYPETARTRDLEPEEWARLGASLDVEEKTSPFAVAGFRLLALTGCRCSEVFRLRWKEVRLDRGVLELEHSKTGARKVPLNAAAVEVLKALPRIEGNEHVIVGAVRGQPFRGEAKVWERIRERAGLDDLRIHDLRHAFAGTIVNAGGSLEFVAKLLGHSTAAMAERYGKVGLSPVRAASEAAGDTIAALLKKPTA